jgi:hypothetical protein
VDRCEYGEVDKVAEGVVWEAKRRRTSKEADGSLSYLKILEYNLHNEKPEK